MEKREKGAPAGRRRRGGKTRGRRGDTSEERAAAALAALVGDAWQRVGAGRSCEDDVRITIAVTARAGVPWKLAADPPLVSQVEGALREAAARRATYRPGHVYCYRCESSSCPHSPPPSPEKVFAGYSPTGVPGWTDFTQLFVDRKHPEAALLFDSSRKRLAALFLEGRDLKGAQLDVFGRTSKTYDILGQVVFGYLHALPPGGGPGERAALTAQAVETRDAGGHPTVALNLLGRLTDGTETVEALEGWRRDRVFQAVAAARRQLVRLGPRPAAGRRREGAPALAEKAGGILRKMAKTLHRMGRQNERRTSHAEERHRQQRPTAKAVEDAAAAPDERLYRDDREGTVIVAGPRGRIHVFSPGGRHVTSLTLGREEVDGRLRRRRWQPLGEKDRRTFRSRLAGLKKNS